MPFENFKLDDLKTEISKLDVPWASGETKFTKMSAEERSLLLGYTPGPEDISLEEAESLANKNFMAFMAAPAAIGYPGSYDLRNVNGKNYITSVKNQGGCGSCVAFGVVATVEGSLRKQRNNPTLSVDYSEAHLFYCHARAEGRRCSNGWWPSKALDAFRDKGVVDEACYPYTAGDQNCTNLCSNWNSRLTKITGWKRITSTADMKNWISSKGPLVACYTVYEDFFAYKSGIYKHVTGKAVGGHCISVVGYNDSSKYWICKNSWGTGFGENGYFRIGYGQCGIDSSMDEVLGIAETGWIKNTRIIGLWTINQTRNAWVYVKDLGWRKISPDNDNIFFDMLAQLAAAKAGNRPVSIRQVNAVIKEVYVF
jgi:C1A family cysteine protease